MIRNSEDFCRKLNNCVFSMGGGNAKGIFALIDYDWTNQDALDPPVKWHCGDPCGTGLYQHPGIRRHHRLAL